MPAKGKHRRPRNGRLTQGFVAAGAGAAFVLPIVVAATAHATPSARPVTAERAMAPAVGAVAAVAATTAVPTTYTVAAGDTLATIADKYSLSGGWKRLYTDNRRVIGGDPAVLSPGITLTIGAKAETAAGGAPVAKYATYSDNLDGWIKESLDIMARHGIPGSYEGIHRNVMRESSGNPRAVNNWDSNAAAGIPSKGLLQIIDPTFRAYHVPGTAMDSFDPVANITAACNYAAARYGSIDNVNSAY
ncbi:hypothetical protein GCM10020367_66510 [Streptomyces sannanensis]|uniref:LysM domain-containing protein n=1 Tax=Streptomyces sannanensis TaxID=285536 RepID=A0ABP6SMM4_9ACTN